MKLGTRVFIVSSLIVMGLIVATYFIEPAAFELSPQPPIEAKLDKPFVSTPLARKQIAPQPVATAPTAAGSAAPDTKVEDARAACETCRARMCTDYKGSGVDLIDGCYAHVNTSQGADATDPNFLRDCQAVVTCAQQHRCALTKDGAAGCYCGSANIDDCIEHGPAADSPCLEQWRRAARSNDHRDVSLRFSDLKYPAGWANFVIECDVDDCKDKCTS